MSIEQSNFSGVSNSSGINSSFNFKTTPNIHFGVDSVLGLAGLLKKLGISKPLIVTDNGIVELGLMTKALEQLSLTGCSYHVYADIVADPPEANVEGAVAMALEYACDGVVGFGGGSSMDVAKLVAVLMHQEQSLSDIYGVDQIRSSRAPLIQIPTTAGTGSEATNVAIITTGESTKAGVVSEHLLADIIVLDPLLTIDLPPHITAATGIDAMVHAIEAFTSKRLKNPMSDMLALNALTIMSKSIRTAVHKGDDIKARSDMLLGAMMAGQAFANAPVGAVHALAYPLGGIYHIPHGLSNSLVLPHVLRFNGSVAGSLYATILSVIEVDSMVELAEFPDHNKAADVLAEYFMNLAKDLGLATNLRDLNIELDGLPELAHNALLQERLLMNNPRTVDYDQALEIYRQAY